MRYRLQVITHDGATIDTLRTTMASFQEMVTPVPYKVDIARDDGRFGFCGNTRRAWGMAAADESVDFVFWLEHDFVFTRVLELLPLARVLNNNVRLAQMSLMRNPINEEERAAGGVFERHRTRYQLRNRRWLEHLICLTTNPSLMRRKFMVENPWPEHHWTQCEGHFSEDLMERGYTFGTWGRGEAWVEHIGVLRTGHSY